MIATYIVTMNQQVREKYNKQEKVLTIISFIAIVCEIFIYYYFAVNTVNNNISFTICQYNLNKILRSTQE